MLEKNKYIFGVIGILEEHIVLNLFFFMWIPKWGLPFLYLLYFKSYCKKRDLVIII